MILVATGNNTDDILKMINEDLSDNLRIESNESARKLNVYNVTCSIKRTILSLLVALSVPVFLGIFWGNKIIPGILIGTMLTAAHVAISMNNTASILEVNKISQQKFGTYNKMEDLKCI